jgi:EmrB/QacA subfamily drug resistance transporter
VTGAPAGTPTQGIDRFTSYCVLGATIIGSSLVFIDGTIITVALPVLQKSLGANLVELQWVVEAYSLMLAALMLMGGMLGDRFGRRRVFALGVVLFSISSAVCAGAADPLQLILARTVQGIGGALLVPGALALISANFPAESRGRAIGTWAAFTAVSVTIGPLLGGWLLDHASWRWIFIINPPLGALLLVPLFVGVPESRGDRQGGGMDIWGTVLATLGLGGVVFGMVEAGRLGFGHSGIIIALVGGLAALVAFVIVERRSKSPMMPLSLFRSAPFSGANLITVLLYGALSGCLFFLPFNLIQVQGLSATGAGASFLPVIAGVSLLSRWTGRRVDRRGGRTLLIAGPAVCALGYALLIIPDAGAEFWSGFVPALVLLGIGMGLAVAPLTTVVMADVPVEKSGIAAGINNTASRVGGVLAIAAFGVVMLAVFQAVLNHELAGLSLSPEALTALGDAHLSLANTTPAIGGEAAALIDQATDDAFVAGFRVVSFISAILALACSACAILTIPAKPT